MSEEAAGKEPDSPGVSPHDHDAKTLSDIHPGRRDASGVSSNTQLDDDPDAIAEMEAALEAAEEAKKAKSQPAKTPPSTLLGSVPPPKTTAPFSFSKSAAPKPVAMKLPAQTKEAEAEQARKKAAADARMREVNSQSARSMQHERARTQQREAAATKILESKEKTATTARLLQKEQEKKLRETFKSKSTKKKKPTKHRNNSRFDDEAGVDNDSDIEDEGDGEEPDDSIACGDDDDDDDYAQKKKKQTDKDKPKNEEPDADDEESSSSSSAISHEVIDDDDEDEDEAVVTKVHTPKGRKKESQERKYPLPADDDDALEQKQQRVDNQKAEELKTQISLQEVEVLRIQTESEAVAQRLAGAVHKRKMLEDQMSMSASGGKEFVVAGKGKKKAFEGVPELFALERMFSAFEKETPYDEDDTEEYELREMVKNVIRNSCEAITETDSACRDLGRKRQRKDPEVVWQLKYTALADSDDEKSARVVVSMTCTESRFEYTGECFAVVKSRSEVVVDELEKARNSWKFMIGFQEENLDFGASLLAVVYYTYRCVIWARFSRALH